MLTRDKGGGRRDCIAVVDVASHGRAPFEAETPAVLPQRLHHEGDDIFASSGYARGDVVDVVVGDAGAEILEGHLTLFLREHTAPNCQLLEETQRAALL